MPAELASGDVPAMPILKGPDEFRATLRASAPVINLGSRASPSVAEVGHRILKWTILWTEKKRLSLCKCELSQARSTNQKKRLLNWKNTGGPIESLSHRAAQDLRGLYRPH